MLIRCQGYNSGAQEYLEEGTKAGREFTRDELDERVILVGDLDLTRMVYESIPDKGQDRYLSYTLAFREDSVPYDTLLDVTTEFKQFLMHAYKDDEFNFYAEAHVPKIKLIKDKATGELTERKPHIHIIIPRKNMLSGREANPAGMHVSNVKYLEAFQEYINQKYNLASPHEHVRIDPKDAASVLSRYKGDDFYGKNREFKKELVKQVIASGVTTRDDFYALVATHGETRIRNEGKPKEYIAVKLPGNAKFTNLKDTIFQDDFIVRRELKKLPLDKKIIHERLLEWPQRAREIKYVSKATPSFRQLYKQSSVTEKAQLLIEREQAFYQTYGACNVDIAGAERSIEGSKAILADAQASLQKLEAPRLDVVHSVSQMDSPAAAVSGDVAEPNTSAERLAIVHHGQPVTVDPADAGDVAKYTRQLTTEVDVQSRGIASATQRIGELVNMRDNHSEPRGPEFIEQCNTEIARAERSIEGSKAIIEQAETSLQKLGAATVEPELSTTRVEVSAVELSEPEEDQGPEMA